MRLGMKAKASDDCMVCTSTAADGSICDRICCTSRTEAAGSLRVRTRMCTKRPRLPRWRNGSYIAAC